MSDQMQTTVEEVQSKTADKSYEEYYEENGACGCTPTTCGCSPEEETKSTEESLPVQYRILREGDKVVELGAINGIESLSASHFIGKQGKVIGICETDEAINTAWENMDQLNVNNVEFRKSDLQNIPVQSNNANVVLGNRILNKTENKQQIVAESHRITDDGGMVCFTELVFFNELPIAIKNEAISFTSDINGIEKIERFLLYFDKAGFNNVQVVEMKKMMLPDESVAKHLSGVDYENFQDENSYDGIFSVTIIADKPGNQLQSEDSSGCCGGSCGC